MCLAYLNLFLTATPAALILYSRYPQLLVLGCDFVTIPIMTRHASRVTNDLHIWSARAGKELQAKTKNYLVVIHKTGVRSAE